MTRPALLAISCALMSLPAAALAGPRTLPAPDRIATLPDDALGMPIFAGPRVAWPRTDTCRGNEAPDCSAAILTWRAGTAESRLLAPPASSSDQFQPTDLAGSRSGLAWAR